MKENLGDVPPLLFDTRTSVQSVTWLIRPLHNDVDRRVLGALNVVWPVKKLSLEIKRD